MWTCGRMHMSHAHVGPTCDMTNKRHPRQSRSALPWAVATPPQCSTSTPNNRSCASLVTCPAAWRRSWTFLGAAWRGGRWARGGWRAATARAATASAPRRMRPSGAGPTAGQCPMLPTRLRKQLSEN